MEKVAEPLELCDEFLDSLKFQTIVAQETVVDFLLDLRALLVNCNN